MKQALSLVIGLFVSSIPSISLANSHLKIPLLVTTSFGKVSDGGCDVDDGATPAIVISTLDIELKDVGSDSLEGNGQLTMIASDSSQIYVSVSHFEKKSSKSESYNLINIARQGKTIAFGQMNPANDSTELETGVVVYLDDQKCLLITAGINPRMSPKV